MTCTRKSHHVHIADHVNLGSKVIPPGKQQKLGICWFPSEASPPPTPPKKDRHEWSTGSMMFNIVFWANVVILKRHGWCPFGFPANQRPKGGYPQKETHKRSNGDLKLKGPLYTLTKVDSKKWAGCSLSCSVTLEKREPFLGKTIFSGAATKKKEK